MCLLLYIRCSIREWYDELKCSVFICTIQIYQIHSVGMKTAWRSTEFISNFRNIKLHVCLSVCLSVNFAQRTWNVEENKGIYSARKGTFGF
jgi:hypothetical protein